MSEPAQPIVDCLGRRYRCRTGPKYKPVYVPGRPTPAWPSTHAAAAAMGRSVAAVRSALTRSDYGGYVAGAWVSPAPLADGWSPPAERRGPVAGSWGRPVTATHPYTGAVTRHPSAVAAARAEGVVRSAVVYAIERGGAGLPWRGRLWAWAAAGRVDYPAGPSALRQLPKTPRHSKSGPAAEGPNGNEPKPEEISERAAEVRREWAWCPEAVTT